MKKETRKLKDVLEVSHPLELIVCEPPDGDARKRVRFRPSAQTFAYYCEIDGYGRLIVEQKSWGLDDEDLPHDLFVELSRLCPEGMMTIEAVRDRHEATLVAVRRHITWMATVEAAYWAMIPVIRTYMNKESGVEAAAA